MVKRMSSAVETSHSKKSRLRPTKNKLVIAGSALALGAIAVAGIWSVNKYKDYEHANNAREARKEKILNDARNSAISMIEQQRLNPAVAKTIGGILIIPEGRILASSPQYLNIQSAPGNKTVPPNKQLVVFFPKFVNNTYQFKDSCNTLPPKKFTTSAETALHTFWVSANVTQAPKLFANGIAEHTLVNDKNSGLAFDKENRLVGCAIPLDANGSSAIEQLASIVLTK